MSPKAVSSTWLTAMSTRGSIDDPAKSPAGERPEVTSADARIAAPIRPGTASTIHTVASRANAADRRPPGAGTNPSRLA